MSDAGGTVRCMVVGYDASDGARRAAAWAINELLPEGTLVLVHSGRALHLPPLTDAGRRAEVARALFDELMLDGDAGLLDLEFHTEVSDKDPVTALIESAESHGADAIVVGSGRHSRLRRALGVVTTELLERSPVAVIAVPEGAEIRPRSADSPRPRS